LKDSKFIFKLKKPVTDQTGKPLRDSQINNTGKTQPILTKGLLLSRILINGVQPENATEAADLKRLSIAVSNIMRTDKGTWQIDLITVQKLISFLNKIPMSPGMQLTVGDLMIDLEEAKQIFK